jgi:predicted regulator of Ras-like GTPase activity (Roadblock/LC7/MglB family)
MDTMTPSSVQPAADQALQELLEVSPQVEAAVIAERSGTPISSSVPGAGSSAGRLGQLASRILAQAEKSRAELGREPVTQCEIATGDGNVFVVADADHLVAAVTGSEPTVGLVFYDLKTALRSVREARQVGADASTNGSGANGAARPSEAKGKEAGA